ncbi:hypothetical protein Hdeb2414_s0032g00717021 [Helianthus debilis subsp. tardiflorus]
MNHVNLSSIFLLWKLAFIGLMALFLTIIASSLKLLFPNSPLSTKVGAFPMSFLSTFSTILVSLRRLAMLNNISLCRFRIINPFQSNFIIFFNWKANHKIFNGHFLPLMLEIVLEINPAWW